MTEVERNVTRPPATRAGRVARNVAGAMLLAAYAWWAVSLPPFSATATAAVVPAGAAALVWGAWVPRRRATRRRSEVGVRSTAPWALVVVLGGVWQLAAYGQRPRDDHPTLSSLANALLDSQPARAAAFVAWLVAAVGLSRR